MKNILLLFLVITYTTIFAAEWKFADSNNQFASEIYKITHDNENYIFSPYSITSAIAMTYAGMDSTTKKETMQTLHFPDIDEILFPAILNSLQSLQSSTLRASVNKDDFSSRLNIANSLWIQDSFEIEKEYLELNKKYFSSNLYKVDFINSKTETIEMINSWIENKTNNLIKNILGPNDLSTDTKLVLCNAIYFKARWREAFSERLTKTEKFYKSDKSEIECQMMSATDYFNFKQTLNYKVIELPYWDGKFSMIIVLPNSKGKLDKLEKGLDNDHITKLFTDLKSEYIGLKIPKFKMETRLNLSDPLAELGMKLAFSNSADFTRINPELPLHISAVIHKAYIAVDEQGTEAAAATVIACETTSFTEKPKPKSFIADHPFMFFIVDRKQNTILFMGKVEDPKFEDKI